MSGETSVNTDRVFEQAYLTLKQKINIGFALNRGGTYQVKGNIWQVQVDNSGRITKMTQSRIMGYSSDGTPVYSKEATLFNYNEHGDITQQIYDDGDDGSYEKVHDFDCEYKDNKLVRHEETWLSRLKNGAQNYMSNLKANYTTRTVQVVTYK